MQIRDLLATDDIAEIIKGHPFSLLNLSISNKVVEDLKGIVAVGQLLPMLELSLMENMARSPKDRVKALRELMIQAMLEANKVGHAQLHGFVRNDAFAQILIKHWGFKQCEGKVLVLNLKG